MRKHRNLLSDLQTFVSPPSAKNPFEMKVLVSEVQIRKSPEKNPTVKVPIINSVGCIRTFPLTICAFFRIVAIDVRFFGQTFRFTVKWDHVIVSFGPDCSLWLFVLLSAAFFINLLLTANCNCCRSHTRKIRFHLSDLAFNGLSRAEPINSENYSK